METRRAASTKKSQRRLRTLRCGRRLLPMVLAWPVFQGLFCAPDLLGALNFELQSLINSMLFFAIDTLFRNLLNL
jgi:hypothetical protein